MADLILRFSPSPTMEAAFGAAHAAARAQQLTWPNPPPRASRSLIDPISINHLSCFYCWQATEHRDENFAWTALWVLYENGHVFQSRKTRRNKQETTRLSLGALIVFDARLWHSTTASNGWLVVATEDFKEAPGQEQVCAAFEARLANA